MRALEAQGVQHMFGIPGGAILPAYDPLIESSIHHILARHEQGAAHAADGYAQASSYMDSVPVVAVTGQVPRWLIGSDGFQETDATGITVPVTKHNWLVMDPGDIAQTIAEAFHIASTGRPGPVLVDIPKDVLQARFPYHDASPVDLPGYQPKTKPNVRQIREA